MALIVVTAVMTGLQNDLREKILGTNPHIWVVTYGEEMRMDGGTWPGTLERFTGTLIEHFAGAFPEIPTPAAPDAAAPSPAVTDAGTMSDSGALMSDAGFLVAPMSDAGTDAGASSDPIEPPSSDAATAAPPSSSASTSRRRR